MMSWASELEKIEQISTCIEMYQAEMEDNGSIIRTKTLVEAELDLEIMGLQAGEGRRGINASESNECCFDATIRQQIVAMGAQQAMQQIASYVREFINSFEVQYEPAPVTPVHVPKEQSQERIGRDIQARSRAHRPQQEQQSPQGGVVP